MDHSSESAGWRICPGQGSTYRLPRVGHGFQSLTVGKVKNGEENARHKVVPWVLRMLTLVRRVQDTTKDGEDTTAGDNVCSSLVGMTNIAIE